MVLGGSCETLACLWEPLGCFLKPLGASGWLPAASVKLLDSHESDWEGGLLGESMNLAPSVKLLPGVPLTAFPGSL